MDRKKIALCFLTYGNLSKTNLWETFINSKYNIYIHNKENFSGVFEKYCIKDKVDTKWGDISLVKATLNLFKEAFIDKENEYFILLSDKCIPLYDSDEIYDRVRKINNNIILKNISKDRLSNNSLKGFDNDYRKRFDLLADKTFFDKNKFCKQYQWMLLKRDTVKFFIENDYTHIFGNNFFAPDEHYFINIINKFNISYVDKIITYVNWNEFSDSIFFRLKPKTYLKLTDEMIKNILKFDTLFMRKIDSKCNLPSYFDKFF